MQKSNNFKNFKSVIFVLIFCIIFFLFEDSLKNLVVFLKPNSIFSIKFMNNYGGAWNILNGHLSFFVLFGIFVFLFTLFYIYKNISFNKKWEILSFSFFLAGVFGNTIERIQNGYVIDYIKLNFINFPIFNLFDIFLTLGVLCYIIIYLKETWKKKT